MAEKIEGRWLVRNTADDLLGDKANGVYLFRSEREAKAAAFNAGPSFSAHRVRLNTGDVKR